MRSFRTLFTLGAVALATAVATPAPAAAQLYECITTTKTVKYYFSDGSYAVDTRSVTLCRPIE